MNWGFGVFIAVFSCRAEQNVTESQATLDSNANVGALSELQIVGRIIEVSVNATGVLNAQSEHLGWLFRRSNGDCFVRLPMSEIPPPGSIGKQQRVECPPSMQNESFQQCGFGLVSRRDDSTCVCQPWGGDPPPDDFNVSCPE